MLPKLSGEIAECYRHATETRECARIAGDEATKQNFLDMERRWLSQAHGYEFAERLSNFTGKVKRRHPKK